MWLRMCAAVNSLPPFLCLLLLLLLLTLLLLRAFIRAFISALLLALLKLASFAVKLFVGLDDLA